MREFEIDVSVGLTGFDSIRIIPVAKRGLDGIQVAVPDGKGQWEIKEFKYGELYGDTPFLTMPPEWGKQLLKALLDHFEPAKDATVAELDAVKYHLEDLRRLIKTEQNHLGADLENK